MRGRLIGVLVAGGAALVLAAPGSTAATRVEQQGWAPARPLPSFFPQEDRVYVAATAGTEEASAFVELGGDGAAGVEAGAELVLVEADDGLLADQAAVAACMLGEALPGAGRLDDAPEVDCGVSAPVTRSATGEWRVPLAEFAPRWAAGGVSGLALVPDLAEPGRTWRVSLDTRQTTVAIPPAAPGPTSPGPAPVAAPTTTVAVGDDRPVVRPADPLPAAPTGSPSPAGRTPPTTVASVETPAPALRSNARDASHPGVAGVLGLLTLAGLAAGRLLHRAGRAGAAGGGAAGAGQTGHAGELATVGTAVAGLLLFAGAGEVTLYKLGLVLIVLVGAIGLHVLVNWAGELSLAHAAFVGAPAFVVAKFSAEHDLSPVYLLPVGVLAGVLLGGLVGLPALRAKGLHVALVTLAAFVAVDRFLFTKSWFVGPSGGYDIPTPSLGPIELRTIRSLYLLLVACVAVAVLAAWLLWRSKFARGFLWMRSMPSAAAAFGIPVASYKVAAYAVAGAFGGFAGGLSVVWVQRLTPGAFPFELSFTYLVIVVLAGRGFLGGVAVAAAALEGGRLFMSGAGPLIAYGGPIGLLVTLTRYKAGVNGLGRQLMQTITDKLPAGAPAAGGERPTNRWGLVGGIVSIAAGLVAIGFGWYHAGNTDQLWIQNQELMSGGVGGLALVMIGLGLLIRDTLAQGQARLAATLGELLAERDQRAASEETATVDAVAGTAEPGSGNGATPGRRRSRALARS